MANFPVVRSIPIAGLILIVEYVYVFTWNLAAQLEPPLASKRWAYTPQSELS